jgi:hypothetical protein
MSDRMIASALAALVLVSRVPFMSQTLWAWDSVLYARALEQGFHVGVDLADQRPHPPGYVFYVGIAAAFRLITRDSNAALVIVSVLASALTAAAVYLLCRRYTDRALSIVIALGAATAPLVWTYGDVAMPYALLGLLSVVLAAALRAGRSRAWPAALVASAGLGLAAGFRQDVLLLLGPLWLWMLATRSWRERALCVAAVSIAALAWFGPSASFSGGPAAYVASLAGQAARVSEISPAAGSDALLRNTLLTVYALWWGLLGFAVLLIAAMIAAIMARRRLTDDAAFFALWLVPAALVYVTIHIGDPGYLMSVLPGLYVACAALIAPVAAQSRRAVLAFAAVLVAVNVAVFVVGGPSFSAAAIARHDRALVQRVDFVRGAFRPAVTVILAQSEYLTARYYLPEYRVLFYGTEPEVLSSAALELRITSPMTVVVFGALAAPLPPSLSVTGDDLLRSGDLGAGATLVAYDLEPR